MSDLPKYVQRVRKKQKYYYYFRRGNVRVPIRGAFKDAEWYKHYAELLKSSSIETPKLDPETFGGLISMYLDSNYFKQLSLPTQKTNRNRLKVVQQVFKSQVRLDSVKRIHAMAYKEKLSDRPGELNKRMSLISSIYNFAIDRGITDHNPFERYGRAKTKPRRQYWTYNDERQFLEYAKQHNIQMYRGYVLGIYTAQRQTDVIQMQRKDFIGGTFSIEQSKTGTMVEIPVHPELKKMIDEIPATQNYLLVNRNNQAFTGDQFNQRFKKVRRAAGIDDNLKFRDLRRTAVTRLTEAGCTVPEIAAVSGHSLSETQRIIDTYFVATKTTAATAINKLIVNQSKNKL